MRKTKVEIQSNARLHLSLFSMHDTGLRINGGIGFAIEAPSIVVTASPSKKFTVSDNRDFALSEEAQIRLINSLETSYNLYSLDQPVAIDIYGDAIANHGFGSGTAVRLSCLEALMIMNDLDVSNSELVRLSGRGGTSGIGVNTYFSGGIILDLGVRNTNSIHGPSSLSEVNIGSSLVLQKHDMPDWDIGICMPLSIPSVSREEEIEFFKKTCPINENESHKALYHSVTDIFASVYEHDKDSFEHGIRELQKCAWKKAERGIHGSDLSDLESVLYEVGATTVGMSSLGPSLFFMAKDVDDIIKLAGEKRSDWTFIKTKASNHGRKIRC